MITNLKGWKIDALNKNVTCHYWNNEYEVYARVDYNKDCIDLYYDGIFVKRYTTTPCFSDKNLLRFLGKALFDYRLKL